MSKISNMSMVEIINKIDIMFDINDISKICYNPDVRERIRELIIAGKDIYEVMIDNEEYIDKEKLLLVTWLQYKKEIGELKKKLEIDTPFLDKDKIEQEIRDNNNKLARIKKISRDMDVYLVTINTPNGELVENVEIISSKEEILGYDFSDQKKNNKKIFNYIDQNLKTEDDDFGMKYALQTLEYEDFYKVLPRNIAEAVEYKIKKNSQILGKEYIQEFFEEEKNGDVDSEKARNIENEYQDKIFLPESRLAIKDVLKYIDLKKLLMIEIYRLEERLNEAYENGYEMSQEQLKAAENVTITLLEAIGKEIELEEYNNYSYKDVKEFLNRINIEDCIYITVDEAKQLKDEILNGLDLNNIEEEKMDKICMLSYTEEEMEKIMETSDANFIFGTVMQDLSEKEILEKLYNRESESDDIVMTLYLEGQLSIKSILELYYDKILNIEFFEGNEILEDIEINNELNIEKINTLYLEIKGQKEKNIQDCRKLDSMINLYRFVNSKDKEKFEEIDKEIIEKAEDEEDIVFYYKNGFLTLETVVEWAGENTIEQLYDESIITFGKLEDLYKKGKISINLLQSKFKMEDFNYSDLISYIDLGYISEDRIINLYMQGKIFDYDFENMFINGKVSPPNYIDATSKRTKETLEENAKIKFKPVLVNIPDKKIRVQTIEENDSDPDYFEGKTNNKTLIDPSIRYEFLRLLGAKEAEAIIEDENNAFYNYEFFVIPDANGELQSNSVVVAERFFKDKEAQDIFATDNATYFFQYKDLMVNSNLTKKEMTEDRENIVFTANHRAGSWAVSVLYRIAETLAGDNFKQYKKGDERASMVIEQLHKIYTPEEIGRILELTRQIDDTGEYIYEEVNSTFSKKNLDKQDDNEER